LIVTIDRLLTFNSHLDITLATCNRSLYALKTMRQHGMHLTSLILIFKATVLSKLLYASPAWHGFLSKNSLDRCQAFLKRAVKFGYYENNDLDLSTLLLNTDIQLFKSITNNPNHVLFHMIPPKKITPYSLRNRGHGLILPNKDDRNFVNRMLYCNLV